MATQQNQYSPAQMRQIRAAQAVADKTPQQAIEQPQTYDTSTTEGQILSARQQLEQARGPAEQYVKQYIYPARRERAFTPRQERAAIQATGRIAKTQLAEVTGQQAIFERDVATKAPEYAKPEYKAQALQEAKSEIQRNMDRIDSRIKSIEERIQYYRDKERNWNGRGKRPDYDDRIDEYEDDISVLRAEKGGWASGLADDNTTIKRFFSGYTAKKADYEASYRDARNRQQKEFNKLKETEAFKADLAKLGLSDKKYISMSDYQQAVGKFNSNLAYEQQLVKYAQQKGFQNLSPALQKQLENRGLVTKSDTGFQSMNAPGYYNPKTGELMSMKPEDAARLGFQKVTATGFNPQTGQYVIKSETGLLTPNQLAAYKLFSDNPNIARVFSGLNKDIQSAPLPKEFIVGGPQKELTFQERLQASPFFRGPITTYELAGQRPEYSTKELEIKAYAENPMKFINEKGYGLDEQGNRIKMYSGQASPITPSDVLALVSAPKAIATFGAKKVAAYALSEPATALANYFYEKAGSPQSWLGKFGKASIASYLITRSPTLSTAYAFSLLKAGVKNREQLLKVAAEEFKKLQTEPATSVSRAAKFVTSPTGGELLGFAVGGQLLKRGLEYGEWKLRGGVESKTINIPNYGDVVSQNIPKYGKVIWIKGSLSASEKIAIMKQIDKLIGPGKRVFVQVSPQGIPQQVFSSTKNLGFQVRELSNPMRGLYQAPPFEFLKKYRSLVGTETGALSYYAGNVPRDSLLPRPIQAIKSLLTKDTATTQRAFQYLERTYKGVETPKWIQNLTKSLLANKGIPKASQKTIDKYFKSFMKKPIQFEGKTYVGLDKLNLVNARNLRGMGSGDKLKVYAALLEYQNLNKLRLVSGAENLAGVLPYGGESQIVTAIGTKYFEKSLADLRKGIKPSPISKVVEWITGTKRGQTVARIEGRMVEIQPVRAFPGKVKPVKLPSVKAAEVSKLNELVLKASEKTKKIRELPSWPGLISRELNVYRFRPGKSISPYRPFIFKETPRRELTRVERRASIARYVTPVRREIRRPEQRLERRIVAVREPRREMPRAERLIIREVPRREIRRPEPRPERQIREPPRRPEKPEVISRFLMRKTEERRKPVPMLKKKKEKRFELLPTLTQEIYRIKRKGGSVRRTRGFEIARI